MLHFTGYIQAAAFAVLFLVYINGELGWVMIYVIAAAVIASIVLFLLSRRHFSVSMPEFAGVSAVGDKVCAEITLTKTGFCFMPFITVEGEFMGRAFAAKGALMFSSRAVIPVRFRSVGCGLKKLTVNSVKISDLLGLFSVKCPAEVAGTSAAVLPRFVDYSGPEVMPATLPAEDDENLDAKAVPFGGVPGYEHRDYIPGDPPRRINYKLSAKKRRLMVRTDESGALQSTEIVLSNDADDNCAEQALALAVRLVRLGGSVKVFYGEECCAAGSPESIGRLREWLAFREFGCAAVQHVPSNTPAVTISPAGFAVSG